MPSRASRRRRLLLAAAVSAANVLAAAVVVLAQDSPVPYPPPYENLIHPLPHTYIELDDLPRSFTWQNVSGHSYLTRVRNQHIPQYCELVSLGNEIEQYRFNRLPPIVLCSLSVM